MKKRLLSMLLVTLLIVNLFPVMSIPVSATAPNSDAEIEARINELSDSLKGTYFTVDHGTGCGKKSSGHGCINCQILNIMRTSWFKNKFGTVSASQLPIAAGGQASCMGFVNFASWYIFRSDNSDSVGRYYASNKMKFNYKNVSENAHLGDYLRLGGHSVIFISCDTSGITVLDCNYSGSYNCMVDRHKIPYSTYSSFTVSKMYSKSSGRPNIATGTTPSGRTSKPSVAVNGQTVAVSWTYSGSATKFDAYILQDPWSWEAIKYQTSVTGNICTFNNVAPGEYRAFVIARPNTNFVQSEWSDTFSISTASNLTEPTVQPALKNGTYSLTPKCAGGMCLDVWDGSSEDETNVQIHQSNGTAAQQWQFTYLNNGYYEIVAQCSGKALDVAHGWTDSGTNVWQYSKNGSNAQQWQLQDAGDGYYYLIPRLNTDLCLDVYDAGTTNGTNVQVWTKNQTDAQKWKISPVSTIPTTPNSTNEQNIRPTNFTLRIDKESFALGETATITPSADNATHYVVIIRKGESDHFDGELVYENNDVHGEITFTPTQKGAYTVRASARNENGTAETDIAKIIRVAYATELPTNLTVRTDKNDEYKVGDTVVISAFANNATFYNVEIWYGSPHTGEWQCEDVFDGQITFTPTKSGLYTMVVTAYSRGGFISTEKRFIAYGPSA